MKRVAITEPYCVEVQEVARPSPGAGEVLVQATVTGFSAGTEMNLYRGTNPDLVRRNWGERWTYPMYPGYQFVGVVAECGPGATGLTPGDRVVGNGPHAEYAVMAAAGSVRLTEAVSDEQASLAVVGRVALRGVRLGTIGYGDSVAVVGMGVMGQLAIQHARLAGAAKTIAVDVDPLRLVVARRLGASYVINPRQEDPAESILDCTLGGADVVIETAGSPSAVPVAFKLARDRGCVVLVGWHLKPVELSLGEDFFIKELVVRASRSSGPLEHLDAGLVRWTTQSNLAFVVSLLAEGRLKTEGLITHVLPFEEAGHAYELISSRSEPSLHVALRWS